MVDANGPSAEPPVSRYLRDLQTRVAAVHTFILSRLQCGTDQRAWSQQLAAHTLVAFVRHLSLIRRPSEAGKLQLAADMAQMELMLAPLLGAAGTSLSVLGAPYRALRAFRYAAAAAGTSANSKRH